ncbi:MAG: hypothetical protein HYU88_07340 [Chloroflexi bacterium]|nr:hypothetical protein [Chloroflexota bacterium]MBI4506665.1 hypothetical protein [Chloroflexota bacterium]
MSARFSRPWPAVITFTSVASNPMSRRFVATWFVRSPSASSSRSRAIIATASVTCAS